MFEIQFEKKSKMTAYVWAISPYVHLIRNIPELGSFKGMLFEITPHHKIYGATKNLRCLLVAPLLIIAQLNKSATIDPTIHGCTVVHTDVMYLR